MGSIAIDGPAGAGKSTIAKRIAEELSFVYVDTGAMYRAMGLYFYRKGIDSSNEEAINQLCDEISVEIGYEGGSQQVYLNGENVTGEIRKEAIGKMASAVSVYPRVREKLVELQRKLAESQNVVMDGRDIGTVVLPQAQLKIYLTASVEARGERRYLELKEKGVECSLEEIERDIETRDYQDMNREVSPLRQAEDAILVDSSNMTIEEVTDEIIRLYRERQ